MASVHDNFRLYATLSGLSPQRMTMRLSDDTDGPLTANTEYVPGQVLAINTEGLVQAAVTTADANGADSIVGVSAWRGEAGVAPIAKNDVVPVLAASLDNLFMASHDDGGDDQISVGLAYGIDNSSGVFTINVGYTTEPVVNIMDYISDDDKSIVVFCRGMFSGNASAQEAI